MMAAVMTEQAESRRCSKAASGAVADWETPIGWLRFEVSELGLRAAHWVAEGPRRTSKNRVLQRLKDQIDGYFSGDRTAFDVPLDLAGLRPFRRHVLETLRNCVAFGQTVTYQELACLAGSPGAARAVGTAMAKNPVPLVVPCHRVVASKGLGGFGPGVELKRWLLDLEGVTDPGQ